MKQLKLFEQMTTKAALIEAIVALNQLMKLKFSQLCLSWYITLSKWNLYYARQCFTNSSEQIQLHGQIPLSMWDSSIEANVIEPTETVSKMMMIL